MTTDTVKAYPITDRNKAKRLHERASYDHETVHRLLDSFMLAHIAYVIDGQPFCTPTLHWREGTRLYWHGSSASRMLRSQVDGVTVCVTVSNLDGLVMSRTGLNHSANYRSVMCFGTARLIEGEEKIHALTAMLDRYYPGRSSILEPFDTQDIKATKVIGMTIDQASAKVRAKGNVDDPEDLGNTAWAGVIPVETIIGDRQPCPFNTDKSNSTGLENYRVGMQLDQALRLTMEEWVSTLKK